MVFSDYLSVATADQAQDACGEYDVDPTLARKAYNKVHSPLERLIQEENCLGYWQGQVKRCKGEAREAAKQQVVERRQRVNNLRAELKNPHLKREKSLTSA